MPINFDTIPREKSDEGGYTLPPEGFHLATIEDAVVKNGDKGDYIALTLKLDQGSKVWDNIFPSSTNHNVLYKVGRLIRATQLPLTGTLDDQDFCNLLKGRRVTASIVHKLNDYKDKKTTRAEVTMFEDDVYYTVAEFTELTGGQPSAPTPTSAPTPVSNTEY